MVGLRRRATLNDVASRAGVSTTTASYILNGRSLQMRISPLTQERVRVAAHDLGYRPNRHARSLRTARTATIGVISDFVAGGHFASHMLSGAGAAASGIDHLLLIGETDGDPEVEARLVEEMVDRQVEGIIYATVVTAEVTVSEALASHRVVLLNCVDPAAALPAVLPDEHEGGRAAAGLLLRAGVAGEVYAVGFDPTPGALAGRLRVDGLRAALAEAGQTLRGVISCDWDVVPAYEAVRAWLARGHRAEALVCLNDRVAMGTYQALEDRGLVVPDDVSVVSFDGSELAGWLRPALTSVALPYAEMGALAVRRLMDPQLERGRSVLRVPMSVIEGRSVGSVVSAERTAD